MHSNVSCMMFNWVMRSMGIIKFIFLAIFLFQISFLQVTSEPIEDKQALLDFIQSIYHTRPLNWESNSSACGNWTGVTCNRDNSRIIALRLPAIGLHGPIPLNTIGRLSAIQILSLRSNALSGTFPSDFSNLENLTSLYLQSNGFTGQLPSDFSIWKNLLVLDLSNNGFNGSIPSSMSNLTHLTALNLSNNTLTGEIPDLNLPTLQLLDISNNNLTGTLPRSLQRFPSSAFSGNHLLPKNSESLSPVSQPSKNSSKLGESAILGIVIGGCVLGFAILVGLLILCCSKKKTENGNSTKSTNQKKEKSVKRSGSETQDRNSGLVFFEGLSSAFDLEDLLRASAEVLGKGIGITYKAALEDATVLAVKRLKELSVTRKEFEQQMEIVGSIRHENVVALRAYYYSKEEKLMVYDYYNRGSISSMLHAKRGRGGGRTPLDWETRVRIAIGTARGIAYIHTQTGGKLVHGNIKASNIFLNSEQYGCVSDLGLATLINQVAPLNPRTPGYRAPEVTNTRKVSQASDVYSYGVLLLELLTGKSPVTSAAGGDEVVHLVRWVNSVIREEWTAEVFDTELLRYPNIEEEMVEMLQLGMACAAKVPEQRPKMSHVVKMVEDILRVTTGNRPSPEIRSEISTPTSIQLTASAIGPADTVP